MSQLHLLLQFGIHKERLYFYRLYLEVQELESSKKSSLFEVLRVVEHFPTLATIKRERKCYVLKLLPTVFSKDKSTFGSKTGNDNFRLDRIQKHETSEAH